MKLLYLLGALALLPAWGRAEATGETAQAVADYRRLGYDNELFTLDGKPFTGLALQTNRAGRLVARRNFRDGRYDGRTEEFATNGVMIVSADFKAGLHHGTNIYWNADGTLIKRQVWKDGQLVESTRKEDLP